MCFALISESALFPVFDDIVPEMDGIKQRHMVSRHSRNESRKRILLGLIGVSPAIGLITRLIDRRLIFNHSIPNDAITIDKL